MNIWYQIFNLFMFVGNDSLKTCLPHTCASHWNWWSLVTKTTERHSIIHTHLHSPSGLIYTADTHTGYFLRWTIILSFLPLEKAHAFHGWLSELKAEAEDCFEQTGDAVAIFAKQEKLKVES